MSVWPTWELQGHGSASAYGGAAPAHFLPPWFNVRLTFGDGGRIDVLAVVSDGRIAIEDMRAEPALALDGFAGLGDWLEGPLRDACRVVAEQCAAGGPRGYYDAFPPDPPAGHRARPSWPRGSAGRRVVAEAYRAAQDEGRDPVLAVMCATGRSRRKSLKLIAGARDAGYLAPRHNRR
ncbi:DUF6214 family protein [Streptomyces sp. NBC_01304]|uniref:DUF6214 family protein n=1 Tax=Streptomyces sp. NBC_01304 TaxID=2903818 RepID=UPI002E12ED02|nr:DUF6214 family protein [Streptomyces sp. NBC_01304]